ncbi:MAG: transposase [Minisyncoccia bacterium]
MSLRKVEFAEGEYYHTYNRGNSKQVIFHDKEDYDRFIKLIFLSNGRESFKIYFIKDDVYSTNRGNNLVNIGAYCLMPNHFHLLLAQVDEGGISKFMQKVSTGYSMYYNNKYRRTGTLFEGKFKSEHADSDRYLKYLFSYIHLNPVKLIDKEWKEKGIKDISKAFKHLENYEYSSYQDYLGYNRNQKSIINPETFPSYFSKSDLFKEEILDWLSYNQVS